MTIQQGCTYVNSQATINDLAEYLMLDVDTICDLNDKGLIREDWVVGLSIYFYDEEGNDVEDSPTHLSITHNLGWMAREVGKVEGEPTLYQVVWFPDEWWSYENGKVPAELLIHCLPPLIYELTYNKDKLMPHNPANGWGDYEGLLKFCLSYYTECCLHPNDFIYCCR